MLAKNQNLSIKAANMKQYKDYGYGNNEFTNAHTFILEPLIKMLPKDGSPILDVGCGNAGIANYLIKYG